MNDLRLYLPNIYEDILEFEIIQDIENEMIADFESDIKKFKNNLFIPTSDSEGISYFEKILGIISNNEEELEERRQRVLNRLALKPPFTEKWLRERLDSMLGIGKYTLNILHGTYTIQLYASAKSGLWFNEINRTLAKVTPTNMVVEIIPFVSARINISQKIEELEYKANYRLGTTWQLGQKPFISDEEELELIQAYTNVPISTQYLQVYMSVLNALDIKTYINGAERTFIKTVNQRNILISVDIDPNENVNELFEIRNLDGDLLMVEEIYVPKGSITQLFVRIEI